MEASVDLSRRTAGSIRSISTSSSRASEGYYSDVERGEKSVARVSHRTPSVGDLQGSSSGGMTSELMQDRVRRKREFRGRHIQMMAIGISLFD
jgi:amino acid permease